MGVNMGLFFDQNNWTFHEGGVKSNMNPNVTVSKKTEDSNSVFTFDFQYGFKQVTITTYWNDKSAKELVGSYRWQETETYGKGRSGNGDITLHIQDNGKRLEGIPKGINGMPLWILVYNSEEKPGPEDSTTSYSFCEIS